MAKSSSQRHNNFRHTPTCGHQEKPNQMVTDPSVAAHQGYYSSLYPLVGAQGRGEHSSHGCIKKSQLAERVLLREEILC